MGIPDPRQNAIVEQEPKEVVQLLLKQEDADMLQQRLLEEQLVQQRLQQLKLSQPQQNLQETLDHSGENTPQEPEANGARQDRNFQNFGQFNQEYQGNYWGRYDGVRKQDTGMACNYHVSYVSYCLYN